MSYDGIWNIIKINCSLTDYLYRLYFHFTEQNPQTATLKPVQTSVTLRDVWWIQSFAMNKFNMNPVFYDYEKTKQFIKRNSRLMLLIVGYIKYNMKAKFNIPDDILFLIASMDNGTIYNKVEKSLNRTYEYRNYKLYGYRYWQSQKFSTEISPKLQSQAVHLAFVMKQNRMKKALDLSSKIKRDELKSQGIFFEDMNKWNLYKSIWKFDFNHALYGELYYDEDFNLVRSIDYKLSLDELEYFKLLLIQGYIRLHTVKCGGLPKELITLIQMIYEDIEFNPLAQRPSVDTLIMDGILHYPPDYFPAFHSNAFELEELLKQRTKDFK